MGKAGKAILLLVILGFVLPLGFSVLDAKNIDVSVDVAKAIRTGSVDEIRVKNNGPLPICISAFEAEVSAGGETIMKGVVDVEDACIMPGQSRDLRVVDVSLEQSSDIVSTIYGVIRSGGEVEYTVYVRIPVSFWWIFNTPVSIRVEKEHKSISLGSMMASIADSGVGEEVGKARGEAASKVVEELSEIGEKVSSMIEEVGGKAVEELVSWLGGES